MNNARVLTFELVTKTKSNVRVKSQELTKSVKDCLIASLLTSPLVLSFLVFSLDSFVTTVQCAAPLQSARTKTQRRQTRDWYALTAVLRARG